MRAGAVTPSKTPVSFDEVVEGVVARSEVILKDHDVRLLIREDLPTVADDVGLIDQALTNVLENAARHAVERLAEVIAVALLGVAGVQSHPHVDRRLAPCFDVQDPLCRQRRR